MIVLVGFALLAGAGTALSPCVLPVLPALLSAGGVGGRRRPLGIVLGLSITFTVTIVGVASVVDGVGLGSDVAAGPELNLWQVMRAAIESQKARSFYEPGIPIPSPAAALHLATQGARANAYRGRDPSPAWHGECWRSATKKGFIMLKTLSMAAAGVAVAASGPAAAHSCCAWSGACTAR